MEDEEDKDAAYEALEKEVQQTLVEISGDASLNSFRQEYEKLAEALQKSHENEERLIKKCRELNVEIQQNTSRVQTALNLSQEDQVTIEVLKQQIARNTNLVEGCQERETANKNLISKLKAEIQALANKLDQGTTVSKKQEVELLQLIQQRDALAKEKEMAQSTSDQLRHVSNEAYKKYAKMQKELEKVTAGIETMKQKLEQKKIDRDSEQKQMADLDIELKELRVEVEQLHDENRMQKKRIAADHETLRQLDVKIKEVENRDHDQEAENKRLMEEKKSLETRIALETQRRKKAQADNLDRSRMLEMKATDLKRVKGDKDKSQRLIDALEKRITNAERERKDFEDQRSELKETVDDATEKSKNIKKDIDGEKKKLEDMLRERDILNKNVITADSRTRNDIDLVKRHEALHVNLQKDIQRWRLDAVEVQKGILSLEKEREKYGVELSVANSKRFAALEELKKRETVLMDIKKETGDVQAKLNQQKNLYDVVCTDRNLYSKNLIESNEEISGMKKKFKIMYHQIDQLKEEIKEKDHALIKEHFDHHKVMKLNDTLTEQIEKARKKVKNMTSIVDTQKEEVSKIEVTIRDAEVEKSSQQKELDSVVSERDILNTQLIHRNEELAVLYEKIKLKRSDISNGHMTYKDLLAEIGEYEISIGKLRAEFTAARSQISSIQHIRKEIFSLEKQMLQENSRKQALVQELSNPLNVHRWRKVEGSDPQTFELLTKVKQLQKRLIQKSEEVVEKDLVIEEKEKLYVQLKNILARQPGPEVSEQLGWYTNNLKEKSKQMQKMSGDLQEYHTKVQLYKQDIEHYQDDIRSMRHQYAESRAAEERDAFDTQ